MKIGQEERVGVSQLFNAGRVGRRVARSNESLTDDRR